MERKDIYEKLVDDGYSNIDPSYPAKIADVSSSLSSPHMGDLTIMMSEGALWMQNKLLTYNNFMYIYNFVDNWTRGKYGIISLTEAINKHKEKILCGLK